MTKKESKFWDSLVRFAKVQKEFMQTRRQFHCCMIVDGNKVLSIACNSVKTHPLAARFYSHPEGGVHAEFAAILAARGLRADYSRCTLYVIRIDNNWKLANSAPCKHCYKLIQDLNFKKIIHS